MATGEVIEAVVEEVAENLEEAAVVTRKINAAGVGYFLGGICLGAAIGFYLGHRFNRAKIYAEAFEQSEAEVEQIREVYQQKVMVAQSKPDLETVVEEAGYSLVAESDTSEKRLLKAPVPISPLPSRPKPMSEVVLEEHGYEKIGELEPERLVEVASEVISTDPDWIWAKELESRDATFPYIIHEDEFRNNEMDYNQVTYNYYAEDDVLVDEDDHPLPHGDIVVGVENLRFGHGTSDANLVYVRNDKLQLEMEICKNPRSYEQEILGLEHSETSEKMRKRRSRHDHDDETP
jgi:hypothetical protein